MNELSGSWNEPSSLSQPLASEPRLLNAFVFDLDGTLLDTMPDLVELTNASLRESGLPERTFNEILSFVGNGIEALIRQAVPAQASEEEVEQVLQRWKNLYPHYGGRLTTEYPEVGSTLAALKEQGMHLAVLSNKFDEGVQAAVNVFFPHVFEVVHGEGGAIPRKPDPAGLLLTIAELNTTAQRTVYVGDSPSDMLVAHRAGAYAVGVSWGYHDAQHLLEAGANVIIEHPQALLALGEHCHGGGQ